MGYSRAGSKTIRPTHCSTPLKSNKEMVSNNGSIIVIIRTNNMRGVTRELAADGGDGGGGVCKVDTTPFVAIF